MLLRGDLDWITMQAIEKGRLKYVRWPAKQLNYAPVLPLYLFPAVPSNGMAFPSVPFGRAVTGQRSADNRK